MSTEKTGSGSTAPEAMAGRAAPAVPVGLADLALTFFRIGATTFGGMWAATRKLEQVLVERKGWLTHDEQQTVMLAATLIPAPKFLAFGGIVGFRLRGWLGSVISAGCLLAPGALFVLLGVVLLTPELLGEAMKPVQRAVGIAITGLLIGNAYHQLKVSKAKGRQRMVGFGLAAAVAVAAIAGAPLLLAAATALGLGTLVMRDEKGSRK